MRDIAGKYSFATPTGTMRITNTQRPQLSFKPGERHCLEISDMQLNEMIKKISTGKDSTLGISQFLKTKLNQAKKT